MPGLRYRRRGHQPPRPRQVAAPTHRRHRLRHPRRQTGMEPRRRGGGPQRPPARHLDPRLPRRQTRRDDRADPRHGRPDPTRCRSCADEPTPAQIAHRLQLLADALRFPWKINAGVTAVDLMLQTRTKTWSPQEWRDVVFAPSRTTPPFGIGDVESDFDWSRPPTSEESQRRYLHAYDRGGSYVAGIAGLELPIGDPVHHPDGALFEPRHRATGWPTSPNRPTGGCHMSSTPEGFSSPAPNGCAPPPWSARPRWAISRRSWKPGSGRSTAGCCWAGTNGSATPAPHWTSTIPTPRPRATRPRSSAPTASASSAPTSTSRARPATAPSGGCTCWPRPRPTSSTGCTRSVRKQGSGRWRWPPTPSCMPPTTRTR